MHGVVTNILDATCTKEHIQWNVKLHEANEEPRRDNISRPKQQERFKHVKDSKEEKNHDFLLDYKCPKKRSHTKINDSLFFTYATIRMIILLTCGLTSFWYTCEMLFFSLFYQGIQNVYNILFHE